MPFPLNGLEVRDAISAPRPGPDTRRSTLRMHLFFDKHVSIFPI
jgi:hypothetical protein